MENALTPKQIYDQLWSQGSAALEHGQPQIDAFLSNRKADLRRGFTLVFRQSPEVRMAIGQFLDELAQVAPDQHFYAPGEFHTTVLSVIPGSITWQQHMRDLPRMRAIIAEECQKKKVFKMGYRGVTASPEAVLIQGFPVDDTLLRLREALRAAFSLRGVGADIDRRYKVLGAHITVMRYGVPGADWKRLLELLKANRTTNFGEMQVSELELISGDWYASAENVEIVETYGLQQP